MTKPRVRFRERQRLTAGDLLAEQDYQLAAAGRHHLGHHDWGVVRGLALYELEGSWFAQAGIAIDGYGREIILPQPVRLTLEGGGPQRVILHYCEEQWPERSPDHCVPEPAPRTRQTGKVIVRAANLESWSDPRDWPPTTLAEATAAGGAGQLRPWPVVLGTITIENKLQLVEIRYLRARASKIRAPSGLAVMKIGRRALSDRYHFSVATKDEKGVETDRFTIDRDGVLRFVKTLVLLGDRAFATVPVTDSAFVRVRAIHPGISGTRIRIAARIVQDPGAETQSLVIAATQAHRKRPTVHKLTYNLTDALRPVGGWKTIAKGLKGDEVIFLPVKGLKAPRRTMGSPLVQAELVDAKGLPYRLPVRRKEPGRARSDAQSTAPIPEQPAPSPAPTQVEARLEPTGGSLSVVVKTEPRGDEAPDPLCVDQRRDDVAEQKAPGGAVRFRPGVGPAAKPLTRFISTRRHLSAEIVLDELQLGLGSYLASDYASRMVIGSREAGRRLNSWFSIAGNGKISVPAAAPPQGSFQVGLVRVNGTVILPPVKAVPTDPLFNTLLILAYIYGLQSGLGPSRFATIAFPDLADVPNNSPLNFKVEVAQKGNQPVMVQGGLITLQLPQGSKVIDIAPLVQLPAQLPMTIAVNEPNVGPTGTFYVLVSLQLEVGSTGAIKAGSSATSPTRQVI